MKLYRDYKKRFKIIFIFSCVLALAPVFFSLAQTAEELQSKIGQKNADIERLEGEMQAYQTELDTLSKQKITLSGSIKALDLTRKKLVADIAVTQNKIDKTNLEIKGLNKDIRIKQNSISLNTKAVIEGIRVTSELENESLVESILSADDFSLIWNDIDNMASVREKIRENITELKQVKGELEDTRSETIDARQELVRLKSKLADQKKIVEQNKKEKNKLLAQTKNSEANYQKLLVDTLARKNSLEKELRDYESQLEYILDPSKLPNAGIFSWPFDYIYVTQLFGKTVDSKRLYASGSHSGVDFRAAVGTPVRAMASGLVAGTGDTDRQCAGASFGKFVFIKYDNGLASAYAHLSLIKVRAGERVSRGTVVAYSGNTGYSTGPHLHVSVYAPNAAEIKSLASKACPGRVLTQPVAPINAYLDPMYYLPPYKRPLGDKILPERTI